MRLGGVVERREPGALELGALLLDGGDDALTGEVLAGGLDGADQGVGLAHAVDAEVAELAVGAVLVPDLLEQLGPGVGRVLDGREVLGGEDAVEQLVAVGHLALGEPVEQRADQRQVGADVGVEPLRVVLQAQRGELAERGVRRDVEAEHEVGAGGLELRDLRADVGVARDVADLGDDLLLEELLRALGAVTAEVVALQEQADLGVGEVLGDVLADDLALDLVVGLPAEGPRVLLGLVPRQRAGGDEQVGHLLLVEEVDDRAVRRRAEAAEQAEDLVLQHELVDDLRGVGRVVAVVAESVLDLAAVDATGALTKSK